MITADAVKTLRGLTKESPIVTCKGGLAYLHARWFVVEVPKALIGADVAVSDDFLSPDVAEWREKVPKEEGEYAQAIRTTVPGEDTVVIKLIASSGSARIHPALFETVSKELPDVSFHLHPGELSHVTIRSQGNLVGGVAQIRV